MIMINELNKILIPVYDTTNKKVRLINSADPVHEQTIKKFLAEQDVNEELFFAWFKKYPENVLNELSRIASDIISYNVNFIVVTVSEFDLLRIYVPTNKIEIEEVEEDIEHEYEYDEYDYKNKYIALEEKNTEQIINIFKLYDKVDLFYFYDYQS